MHLTGKIDHALKTCQAFLAFMVVIAESHPQFVGDGAFLDTTDKQVRVGFLNELGKLKWIGVIKNDGAIIAELGELLIVFGIAGL